MPSTHLLFNSRSQGFTLVELVIVIILLAVLSISITNIFRDTTEGYLQADARQSLFANGRLAVERIGREVREAVPNSVRVNATNDCVEFVPIVAASRYLTLPTLNAAASMTVAELDSSSEVSGLNPANLWVMVMTLNESDVYNISGDFVAPVASLAKLGGNQTQINFSAPQQFSRTSPQQRVFLVRQPVSFCLQGTQLQRFTNYGFNLTQPPTTALGTGSLLINNALLFDQGSPISVFRYFAGTLNRNALLLINLRLQGRAETINLEHEIHVRNFP